jgi:hypothetical protein
LLIGDLPGIQRQSTITNRQSTTIQQSQIKDQQCSLATSSLEP